jgi:FKBP-type peptidyl-prolyl cis-trans isomerase
MGIIEETEERLAALQLRLPELEGKANKKERTQVNKEIYNLENNEEYVAAVKARLDDGRAAAAADDDAAHAAKLKQEEEAAAELAAQAAAKAEAKAAAGADAPVDDGENHLEFESTGKGDGETTPKTGDSVWVTYTGTFAEGTLHGGKDWSSQQFDSTWDSKAKKHKPLNFQHFGGKAIRGWDEALKGMSLGEKAVLKIGPKWAYRKGGIQDDNGTYIVPPNATLVFDMQLVGVRDKKLEAFR